MLTELQRRWRDPHFSNTCRARNQLNELLTRNTRSSLTNSKLSQRLLTIEGGNAASFGELDTRDGFRRFFRVCGCNVRDFFFIPKLVSESYMGYVKWKFLHRVFSSALQVLATQSAVHRSFAIADNLGELSAKAQIQTVCFDNLGLLLAALLNMLLKNNQRHACPLLYPIFSALDLCGIYQGLKHVHLQTSSKDRLEIVLNTWIKLGKVPSPAEVSKEDGIDFLLSKDRGSWPIRIGYLNPKNQIPKLSMMAMRSTSDDDYYFITMEIFNTRKRKPKQHGVLLCLRERASTVNIIMGLLQACYIRRVLLMDESRWADMVDAADILDSALNEWRKLIEECRCHAQGDIQLLNEQMAAQGWATKNVLLNTREQIQYNFVDD